MIIPISGTHFTKAPLSTLPFQTVDFLTDKIQPGKYYVYNVHIARENSINDFLFIFENFNFNTRK